MEEQSKHFEITHPKTNVKWRLPISHLGEVLKIGWSYGVETSKPKELLHEEISSYIDGITDKTRID
jgi:hypothetical protein